MRFILCLMDGKWAGLRAYGGEITKINVIKDTFCSYDL